MQITEQHTAAALATAETRDLNNTPEWLRIKAACRRFDVSRSWLYARLAEGCFKSVSIRKRGAINGVRLISRDSLAAFIEGSGH